jgi:hypothetical protein
MRYLIGLLLFIFLVIFIIIRIISGGGGEERKLPPSLASYADTETTVSWVGDDPTQASEKHRNVNINVGRNVATVTITKGYEGEIVSTHSFPMNTNSYSTFLKSLQKTAGFNLGNSDEKLRDQTGYCANGNRYSYDIYDGSGGQIQHFWSTSCPSIKGTFLGNPDFTAQLFKAQIPGYSLIVDAAMPIEDEDDF